MGGGVIRTAAQVAGVGVVNAGIRGAAGLQTVEQPMGAAARKAAAVPMSSVITSAKVGGAAVAAQRASWELDDWEFAGFEEEVVVGAGEPPSRVVFGGVPSLQEAKEATAELKDALDQFYLPPSKSTGPAVDRLGLLHFTNSDHPEMKACITSAENTVAPLPVHAIQAFTYLQENPVAQDVVASIASDPNVWSAVMRNEVLKEFLQGHKTCPGMALNVEESVAADNESVKIFEELPDAVDSGSRLQDQQTPKSFEVSYEAGSSGGLSSWFATLFETMKLSLAEMVGKIFGRPDDEKFSVDAKEKVEGQSMNFTNMGTLGGSLMGLAVVVMMVVVMKRA